MKSIQKTISFLFFIVFLLHINLCTNNIKLNALKKNTFFKINNRLLEPSSDNSDEDSESESESESEGSESNGETTDTTTSYNASNSTIPVQSSSSGLSTGAICAIAIPCIAGLLGVAAAAALCKGGAISTPALTPPTLPPANYIDTSIAQFNVPQETPIQPVETIQPQPVQYEPIQPQPVQQIIRPIYPISKPEPPVINKAFQPMNNQAQMQMVPVQQVEMVPVQQVEMVPVQEIVPLQQAIQVQQVVPQAVQVVPTQQVVGVAPQNIGMIPGVQQIGVDLVGHQQIGQGLQGQVIQNNNIGDLNYSLTNLMP